MKKKHKFPFYSVPFFYDYAFKNVVAEDNAFCRKLIECSADLTEPIQRLQIQPTEIQRRNFDGRAGFYDVFWKNEHLWVFILEMQRKHQDFLPLRLIFYEFYEILKQIRVRNENFENIEPVILICLLEKPLYPNKQKYIWNFMLRDEETGMVLDERAQIRLIEIEKFPILRGE